MTFADRTAPLASTASDAATDRAAPTPTRSQAGDVALVPSDARARRAIAPTSCSTVSMSGQHNNTTTTPAATAPRGAISRVRSRHVVRYWPRPTLLERPKPEAKSQQLPNATDSEHAPLREHRLLLALPQQRPMPSPTWHLRAIAPKASVSRRQPVCLSGKASVQRERCASPATRRIPASGCANSQRASTPVAPRNHAELASTGPSPQLGLGGARRPPGRPRS